MSRLGKRPISLPKGVEIKIKDENLIEVKGPKGHLTQHLKAGITIDVQGDEVYVNIDEKLFSNGKFHGLYRSLVNNMILGVSVGFEKKLTLIGVGFRAAVQGNKLDLQLGFSHPTKISIPQDIQVKVDKSVNITVAGIDKQSVGQFAAKIRDVRPPEPYKGKGVRYVDEYVRKKAGKAAKTK